MYAFLFLTFYLTIILSCTSGGKIIHSNEYTHLKSVENATNIKENIISQMKFIQSYYQPHKDPYSGTYKISLDCAKKNIFKDVKENSAAVYMAANIYLTKNNSPGACPETPGAKNVVYVIYSCLNSSQIHHGFFTNKDKNFEHSLDQVFCR